MFYVEIRFKKNPIAGNSYRKNSLKEGYSHYP